LTRRKEEKRLDNLDFLKSRGGPFTDASEVEQYLTTEDLELKEKVKRLKSELQFAPPSSPGLIPCSKFR